MIRFTKNSNINMIYNPKNPQNAKVDSFNSIKGHNLYLSIISLEKNKNAGYSSHLKLFSKIL